MWFERFRHKVESFFCKEAIDLPFKEIENIIERNNAEPWFIYAFQKRAERWHIWDPCLWICKNISKNGIIFESGCGCAFNLIWLGQRGFRKLSGSDISKSAINAGKELISLAKVNIELWQDDALHPSSLPKNVDVVLALNWTYHLEHFDLKVFLSTYSTGIKDSGYIIIDAIDKTYDRVPNNQYLTSDWGKPEEERQQSEYKKRYSFEEVSEICREEGLIIIKTFVRPQVVPRIVYILKKLSPVLY